MYILNGIGGLGRGREYLIRFIYMKEMISVKARSDLINESQGENQRKRL